MLRTALKPRWIAALLLALAVSTVFVLLSQWQFSRSAETGPPPPTQTEQVKPLVDVAPPARELTTPEVDHRVSMSGRYLPGQRVFVAGRLENGDRGYWVVEPFEVAGAPAVAGWSGAATVIPVARGWVADPADAGPTPDGTLAVTGRLLPAEAPRTGDTGPADQVGALAPSQLVNRWDRPSWAGFVTADTETRGGTEVGARAAGSGMRGITTSAQPTDTPVNWLNIFYAVEWVVFAGFAIYLWWRLVADDHQRSLENEDEDGWDDDEASATVTGSTRVPSSLTGDNLRDSDSVPRTGNPNEVQQ
ncbi:SURF1-like protein [Tersicoccus solisilvae]|uniref:SURF1-like protein n=1 Tax=Tersicoccus solisilvae TaxID=1882339 RepID=A0ABQ1NUY7_9MICC|nr:SURF1 family protein [Tersicoccus solisilvae]GGC85592.1 SURF1-like protein [Tersicoccus solisilvae]